VEAEELFQAFYYSLGLPLKSVIEWKQVGGVYLRTPVVSPNKCGVSM
jgi:hypothetical protein